ncbi:MAG: phosphatidate cytidylyltransferase [Terracidiphilus sp.]
MKRIVTALVLIPLVLILVFLPAKLHWIFALAVAGVAALAAWEFLGLAHAAGAKPPRVATIVAIVALFAGNFLWPDQTVSILGILIVALLVYCTFLHPVQQVMGDLSTSVLCLVYVGFMMIAFPALHELTNGPSLIAFLLCVVWAGDTAALYVGRSWGRHKLAPSVSPGKSWEGSLGSVVGSLIAAGALLGLANLLESWNSAKLTFPEDKWFWLGLAVLINVAAQVGDLVESALKRSAGAKDSGSLLPGHGGVLDRIDALLLAAPALWYALLIHQRF